MPSSSTHSTTLERHIKRLFISSSTHLYHAGFHRENASLIRIFADLLDTEVISLHATLKPSLKQYDGDFDAFAAEVKYLNECKAASRSLKLWAKVWSAGDDLEKVAAALLKVGREEEARRWGAWGEELHRLSSDVMEHERVAESRRASLRSTAFIGQLNDTGDAISVDDHERKGGIDLSGFS